MVPFKVLPKTVMLPLPEDVDEVDVVVEIEVVFDEVVIVVAVVVGVDDVEVVVVLDSDVALDKTEVVAGDEDVDVEIEVVEDDIGDIEGIVVVDVDEDETVVTDELGKIRGESTRVNRTSEDTRITTATAPIVTLCVLFIVFIRT